MPYGESWRIPHGQCQKAHSALIWTRPFSVGFRKLYPTYNTKEGSFMLIVIISVLIVLLVFAIRSF
ncbi:MAG: hypothetical protein OXI67_09715 [Candidatus Poribacteria bacterium]|nr:hypothetical protein [Candidatus Poribacteria bacterium]